MQNQTTSLQFRCGTQLGILKLKSVLEMQKVDFPEASPDNSQLIPIKGANFSELKSLVSKAYRADYHL